MCAQQLNADGAVASTKDKTSSSTWTKIETPLDFSFLNIISPKDLLNEEPRGRKERKSDEKYDVKCLKLNNNHIQDASGLFEVAGDIILQPGAITWIDLSFNSLQKIDPVFCQFPELQILYLHGNSIENIKEVDKLSKIKTLKKLALHGNNMETTKNYRLYVISRCQQLTSFDMSTVSKAERETASVICKSSPKAGRKRIDDDV